MNLYLSKNPEGKKLHDPLAMVVAIEPDVCEFRDVEVYRQRGEWGSRLKEGSDVAITVALKDRKRFFEVLTDSDYSGPI
jgi:pyrimidine-specific ribonucleoside hydrolase